ncbi:MAG TPA: potassium channel family protein [Pyrinomonadaceae bacterium]|nr:potassium channel family protein [Pyrinomonadaceae bacterium]
MGQVLAAVVGVAVIVTVVWDGFETIVLPRRVSRRLRLTRIFYRTTWAPIAWIAARFKPGRKRDRYLSYYGPLSLILLIIVWAVGLVLGFALLQWAVHSPLQTPEHYDHFGAYLYMSGVTFFTLGFGDVFPLSDTGRTLAVVEAGTGFGFLAAVIGYLPVLYQSFSRREVTISMLDARAGTPPTAVELLRRYSEAGRLDQLNELLQEWERWAADLLESHLSYPVLCYYRSQHDNQSWLASLTCVLDTCALVLVGVDGAHAWQARLTFAIARHAVVDISQIFNTRPVSLDRERMPEEDFLGLRAFLSRAGLTLRAGSDADDQLRSLRRLYEPYVNGLSCHLLIPLPPWLPERARADNWQTSAFDRAAAAPLTSSPSVVAADDGREHF